MSILSKLMDTMRFSPDEDEEYFGSGDDYEAEKAQPKEDVSRLVRSLRATMTGARKNQDSSLVLLKSSR